MEDPETDRSHHESVPSSSSSSSSPSTSQAQEQTGGGHENGNNSEQQPAQSSSSSAFSYRVNVLISDVAAFDMKDDLWSGLVVLVTFWFFGQFLNTHHLPVPIVHCLCKFSHVIYFDK